MFLKLIISTVSFLKDLQNVFIQSLPLKILRLFSMFLDDDIVDSEKPNGMYSLTFVVSEFSGLFLHP